MKVALALVSALYGMLIYAHANISISLPTFDSGSGVVSDGSITFKTTIGQSEASEEVGAGSGASLYPFTRLEEGLDLARPGDTLVISPGNYDEAVVFDENITIVTEPDGTVIVGR